MSTRRTKDSQRWYKLLTWDPNNFNEWNLNIELDTIPIVKLCADLGELTNDMSGWRSLEWIEQSGQIGWIPTESSSFVRFVRFRKTHLS